MASLSNSPSSSPSATPSWLTIFTFSVLKFVTEAATRFLMPKICFAFKLTPGFSSTTIEAVGSACLSVKTLSFGMAILTVAFWIDERLSIVLASSPSSAL